MPTRSTLLYNYNEQGIVSTIEEIGVESEDSLITKLGYDRHFNPTTLTLPTGAVIKREFDSEGNCTKITSPTGVSETMSYDNGNRMIQLVDGEGIINNLTYNGYGDVTCLDITQRSEERGTEKHKIIFSYTPFGKLVSRYEDNKKTTMLYDTEDRLIQVQNEANEKYFFERDGLGNVVAETCYYNVRKQYSYSPAGKLTGVKRGNTAKWVRMKYEDGNVSEVQYEDAGSEYFTYGLMGELLTAENQHYKVMFEYDQVGNLVKEVQNGYTVEKAYSPHGALTHLKTSLVLKMEISLNKHGQAEEISAGFGNSSYSSSMTYNQMGQRTQRIVNMSDSNKLKDTWSYDKIGRPTKQSVSINNRESNRRQYHWEKNNCLMSIIDEISNMGVEYSYSHKNLPEIEKFKNIDITQKRLEQTPKSSTRYFDDTG